MPTDRKAKRKTVVRSIAEAIEKGATTVEDVHKSIAQFPLKVLEESDVLRGPAKEVRRIQDHMIGVVYDLIRYINGQVGTLATKLLDQAANRRRAAQGEEAKHHATS